MVDSAYRNESLAEPMCNFMENAINSLHNVFFFQLCCTFDHVPKVNTTHVRDSEFLVKSEFNVHLHVNSKIKTLRTNDSHSYIAIACNPFNI